jgi:hypothetical protein
MRGVCRFFLFGGWNFKFDCVIMQLFMFVFLYQIQDRCLNFFIQQVTNPRLWPLLLVTPETRTNPSPWRLRTRSSPLRGPGRRRRLRPRMRVSGVCWFVEIKCVLYCFVVVKCLARTNIWFRLVVFDRRSNRYKLLILSLCFSSSKQVRGQVCSAARRWVEEKEEGMAADVSSALSFCVIVSLCSAFDWSSCKTIGVLWLAWEHIWFILSISSKFMLIFLFLFLRSLFWWWRRSRWRWRCVWRQGSVELAAQDPAGGRQRGGGWTGRDRLRRYHVE